MILRWALLFLLLGVAPANAQSSFFAGNQFYGGRGGNTSPPQVNVLSPSGSDDTPAVQAAVTNSATKATVLGAGTFQLTGPITLGPGTCLAGAGMGLTTLHVTRAFNPGATGVLVMTDGGSRGVAPCVHDLHIQFDQPYDQASRAAFLTLSQGCTTGSGGSGCKYPPAIFVPTGQAGSEKISNVMIGNAWDGITDLSANGVEWDTIRIASLNSGITTANGFDFGFINNYEQHQQFGLCDSYSANNNPCGSGGLNTIYRDGNHFGAILGEMDGTILSNWRMWESRVQLTSAFSWGFFNNLALDGNNSTLEILGNSGGSGVTVSGGYASGGASGANSNCQIQVGSASQRVTIQGFVFLAGGPGVGGLCVQGGTVQVNGATFSGNGINVVNLTGGHTNIIGSNFASTDAAYSATSQILVGSGASATLTGNAQQTPATHGESWATFASDSVNNLVINNNFNGWLFLAPGTLGLYYPNEIAVTSSYFAGAGAGRAWTTATNNTGIGNVSLHSVTTGTANTAEGFNSCAAITSTANNTCFGAASGQSITGTGNAGFGQGSLLNETSGNFDIGFGPLSGSGLTSGSRDLLVGPSVGSIDPTTGSNDILLGTTATCNTPLGSTHDTFYLCATHGPTPAVQANLAAGALTATVNGGLTVQNTVEVLATDENQAATGTTLAFADVTSLTTGQAVTGTNVAGSSTISSLTGTTQVVQPANGGFPAGEFAIPFGTTTGFAVGQVCVDNTSSGSITAGATISILTASTSASLSAAVTTSGGSTDSITCSATATAANAAATGATVVQVSSLTGIAVGSSCSDSTSSSFTNDVVTATSAASLSTLPTITLTSATSAATAIGDSITCAATQSASGSFPNSTTNTIIPMAATGSYVVGQQCVDTTSSGVIADGDTIASVQTNASITLASGVSSNSAGSHDTIKCDPVVTLNNATTPSAISSGAAITFTQAGTGLIINPTAPASCAGQVTGTLWNNSGAAGFCP